MTDLIAWSLEALRWATILLVASLFFAPVIGWIISTPDDHE